MTTTTTQPADDAQDTSGAMITDAKSAAEALRDVVAGDDPEDVGLWLASTKSYEEAGVLTTDAGFELYIGERRFQVTVVEA